MKSSVILSLISLAAFATIGASAYLRESAEATAPDLAPLDKAMHERFEVPEGFGMSRLFGRMPITAHTSAKPILSSKSARAAADELRKQGWEINFYLGGRELLEPERKNTSKGVQQQQASKGLIDQKYRDLRGPVALTDAAQFAPPNRDEIMEQAKLALEANKAQGYRQHVGDWQLTAYQVTATNNDCVRCHNYPFKKEPAQRLKIGDVLGVTVYAYRRAAPKD